MEYGLFSEIARTLRSLGPWVLAPVFVYLVLESSIFLGLILPGEIVVVFIGALAGQNIIDFRGALAAVIVGSIAGDNLGYFVGMRYGESLFAIWPWLRRSYERHSDEIRGYLERWGVLTILAARVSGMAEAFVPFICGLSGLAYGRFAVMDLLADAVWAGGLCTAGYLLGRQWKVVNAWLAPIGGGLMILLLLAAGWLVLWRWRQSGRSP